MKTGLATRPKAQPASASERILMGETFRLLPAIDPDRPKAGLPVTLRRHAFTFHVC